MSVVQEMLFKRFLIWSSGSPPVWWSRTIYAILKEGSCEVIWNMDPVILLPAHPASFAHKFLFQRVPASPGMH